MRRAAQRNYSDFVGVPPARRVGGKAPPARLRDKGTTDMRPVSELKADEETESDCYNTQNPQSKDDCLKREVAEGDEYCCLFEIETHKKKTEKRCSGLTEFQYNHIKLYVKEKMDELLYRNFHIHCNSLKLTNSLLNTLITLIQIANASVSTQPE